LFAFSFKKTQWLLKIAFNLFDRLRNDSVVSSLLAQRSLLIEKRQILPLCILFGIFRGSAQAMTSKNLHGEKLFP